MEQAVASQTDRERLVSPVAPDGPVTDPTVARRFIGPLRGHALNLGTLAVLTATAPTADDRARSASELCAYRDALSRIVRHALRSEAGLPPDGEAKADVIRTFVARVALIDDARDFAALDWRTAEGIAASVRNDVVPAVYDILGAYERLDQEAMAARVDRLDRRAATVNAGFAEMERIGRMIGLISINASVEAARTGGDGGRAFQVIAEEVRNLAQQSARITKEMKTRLSRDADTIDPH